MFLVGTPQIYLLECKEMAMLDYDYILELASKGKTLDAISILVSDIKGKRKYEQEYKVALVYKSRLNRLNQDSALGLIERDAYNIQHNKIEYDFITLIRNLENSIPIENLEIEFQFENSKKELIRYTEAIKLAEIGIWEWTKEKEFHSPLWKQMLGYSAEEFQDEKHEVWRSLLHPDDKINAIQEFEFFIEEKSSEYNSIFRLLCSDGSYKWIVSKAKVVKRDKKENIKRIVGIHQDVDFLVIERNHKKRLVEQLNLLQGKVTELIEEKMKLQELINEALPVQNRSMDRIMKLLNSLEDDIKQQISPILEAMFDMENIVHLINSSINADFAHQTTSERDFEIKSAVNGVVRKFRNISAKKKKAEIQVDFVNLQNHTLSGYFSQLKSLTYWLIQFYMRNSKAELIKLHVKQLFEYPLKDNEVYYKMYVVLDTQESIDIEKLTALEDYIKLGHKRTGFIEEELLYGLAQVVKMIYLINGKIEVNLEQENNKIPVAIYLKFRK